MDETQDNREKLILSLEDNVNRNADILARRLGRFQLRDELVQQGWIGAIKAVDRYDSNQNDCLAAWANKWIRGSMLDYVRNVNYSRHVVRPALESLERRSRFEFGGRYEWEIPDGAPLAIDELLYRESIDNFRDNLRSLPPRLLGILHAHYFKGQTLAGLASTLGCSSNNVSQLIRTAFSSLKAGGNKPVRTPPTPCTVKQDPMSKNCSLCHQPLPPEHPLYQELTPRETEVATLLGEGMRCGAIAERLNLSTKTVEAHKFNIYRKLNLHNLADLIRYCIKNGLCSLGESSDTNNKQEQQGDIPHGEESRRIG